MVTTVESKPAQIPLDLDSSAGYWIASTAHAIRRALDCELSNSNITARQWEVLALVESAGEPTQVELASRLCIEAHTLAGIISRLERDGWLQRWCCPNDRRKKRLRLTDKTEELWNRMVASCLRIREQATSNIAPGDLDVLRRVCQQIRQNLSQAGCDDEG